MASYQEEWITGPTNTNFYSRRYVPSASPKAHVVCVHGFQEHIGRYDHVFQRVQRAGIEVFAFDQRGWGRTVFDEQHKSPNSHYGVTTRPQQLGDLEFFVKRESEKAKADGVPLFLWGHSMGGALVLSFVTAKDGSPAESTINLLSGALVCSPLIQQTTPASKLLRVVGSFLSKIVPWASFPAEIPAADLSKDSAVVAAARIDTYMKPYASLGCLDGILSAGDFLHQKGYKDFPKDLPLLMWHGTADKVCSYHAAKAFYEQVTATDKNWIDWPDSYHEILNEPNGVWEKATDEAVSWFAKHAENKDQTQPARL
ncbi:hypothetical protein FS837_011370 [Tulasnella sp. UAMH 9824]|nr:hypothetical protein FS837_011370 [Tulasnella sp. UAMH 9824]